MTLVLTINIMYNAYFEILLLILLLFSCFQGFVHKLRPEPCRIGGSAIRSRPSEEDPVFPRKPAYLSGSEKSRKRLPVWLQPDPFMVILHIMF